METFNHCIREADFQARRSDEANLVELSENILILDSTVTNWQVLIQDLVGIMQVQVVDLFGKRIDPGSNASRQAMGVPNIKC